METGRKIFRVTISNSEVTFSTSGDISNKKESIMFAGSGEYINERLVGIGKKTTKRRVGSMNDNIVTLIALDLQTYLNYSDMTDRELFYSGEIHIWENTIISKFFPVKNMVVLRDNGSLIEDITSLCVIDKINGSILIPETESNGVFSLLYSQKRFSKVSERDMKVPDVNKFGINIVQV